jgi:sec-independent protein translocase protein TatB
MFGIGVTELLLILVLATIFLGPERMIEFAGQLGRWVAKLRAQTSDVTREFRDAFDVELGDLKEEVNEVKQDLESLKEVGQDLASPLEDPHSRTPGWGRQSGARPAYNLPTQPPTSGPGARLAAPGTPPQDDADALAAPSTTVAEPAAEPAVAQDAHAAPVEATPEPEVARDLSPDAEAIEISVGVLVGEDDEAEPLVLEGPVLMDDPYAEEEARQAAREAAEEPGEEA